jgi:ribosome-binding factor A
MSLKIERLSQLIHKEISRLLLTEVKDSKIGYITIVEVRLTNDLSYATIYYSIIGDEERVKITQEALMRAKGFLKNEIAKVVEMRKVPELIFKYDESLSYGNKIEKIIGDLK